MSDPVTTENPYSLQAGYRTKAALNLGSTETAKRVMEHKTNKFERFTKTGKKGIKVSGTAGKPDYVDAFEVVEKEGKLLAKLDHPNIVKVNDLRVSEDGQEITLIEPLLKGETLDKTILRLGKTPAGFRIKMEIMRQVADALDYCHTQGVVYADLKMGSILVELNEDKPGDFKLENVTLIDFGQSIEINKPHPLDGSHFDIRYGAIEQYLAQEQGNRDLIRNPLVDYQSFGTLLYEVFTGSHPSKYRSYQPTLMQRPNSYDLTKAPKEARDLMRHILSCNPEERKQVGTLKKFVDQVDIAYEDHRRTGLLAHVRQQLSILNRTKT